MKIGDTDVPTQSSISLLVCYVAHINTTFTNCEKREVYYCQIDYVFNLN